MNSWLDFYSILQVPQNAAQDMIERAYKGMCKKYHPDINRSPDAENRMKEINIAYEVLGDEQRRRQYNTQWMLRKKPNFSTASTASARPNSYRNTAQKAQASAQSTAQQAYATAEKAREAAKKAAQLNDRGREAKEIMQRYFTHLTNQLYKEAYSLLCGSDRKNASLEDFTNWQKAVNNLYDLRSHHVLTAQADPEFKMPDGKRVEAYKCTVQVVEEERKTEKISRYSLHKYIVEDNGRLLVFLGYKDIANITARYRFQASAFEESAVLEYWETYKRHHDIATGLLNIEGFVDACKKEVYRYDRYKVDCCVLYFRVELPAPAHTGATLDSQHSKGNILDRLEMFIADSLKKRVRCVDIPALYSRQHFVCLLAHTNVRGAKRAMKRLKRLIIRDIAGSFELTPRMRMVCTPYNGGNVADTVEKCRQILADQDILGKFDGDGTE